MRRRRPIRCLILACGNPLRGDDGIGPWLGAWAYERFRAAPDIRVIARQQWGPELAEEIARAENVLFVDASCQAAPGSIVTAEIQAAGVGAEAATHHLDAAQLLIFSRELYGSVPRRAILLTVGIESVALGEGLSNAVRAAVTEACTTIQEFARAAEPSE